MHKHKTKTLKESREDRKLRFALSILERDRFQHDAPEPYEIRMRDEAREAREARDARWALESESERDARWAKQAQEAQEARERKTESAILLCLRQAAAANVPTGIDPSRPSGGREFNQFCLACKQAGDEAVADYLRSKEAANQALLQKARDEGSYG